MNVIVDNLQINYQQYGRGRDILLLHGWADRQETFHGLGERLKNDYRLTVLDLPGFGRSDPPSGAWNLDDYAVLLNHFLKKLEVEEVYAVIGHSNGGALAILATSKGLLRVEKMILLSAAGIRNSNKRKNALIKIVAKFGKIATFWLPHKTRQYLQKKLYGTVGSDYLVAPHMKDTFRKTVAQDVQVEAEKISQPVLLIYGENDKATPVSFGKRYAELMNSAQLRTIDNADHFVHQTHPDTVAQLIKSFLAGETDA